MSTFDPDNSHADAIAYRYGHHAEGSAHLAQLTLTELVARAEAATTDVDTWRTDWAAVCEIARRSGIAHTFEAGYSRDLEERYAAVRALVPDADPDEWGGEFDAAYDAYADSHPEILFPTARALAWAREQIAKERSA